ncbi:hypothetical protein [Endozoicomonas arenosclerae]|uniref:hypothetical protein n=1 Tax=Endozoicomonas arenosclerae TaxID=1633495 RepID=UPI0007856621|nr:hypothetical protein [Endozoicomonas arenosclerae]
MTQEYPGYQRLYPNESSGRKIFVKNEHYSEWEKIQQKHVGNFYFTSLLRAIYNLQAVAKGSGQDVRGNGRLYSMDLKGAKLSYRIKGTNSVLIEYIDIEPTPSPSPTSGLHTVRYDLNREEWVPIPRENNAPDFTKKIHHESYMVVSGKYDDLADASSMIVEHIQGAYGLRPEEVARGGNAYNLFWQREDFGKQANVESLASIIQQSQKYMNGVSWLVQGEGVKTFAKALESLHKSHTDIQKSGISTEADYQSKIATVKHRIYFSAPRGGKDTKKDNLKRLVENTGMTFHGLQYNDYDMKNPDIRKNFKISCEKIYPTAFVAGSLGTAALKTTGIGSLVKIAEQAATLPMINQAGLAVAGVLVVKNKIYPTLSGYGRALANFGGNTFGKGNQGWQGA